MKRIGIVGHGTDKFTAKSKDEAFKLITEILSSCNCILISGHSPVGGIDIWAEECAKRLDVPMELKIPKQRTWNAEYGFKQRNLDIAKYSDEVHVILVDKYPPDYRSTKFPKCYHCGTYDHVKSGACWTGKKAKELGKPVIVHIIKNG